VFLVSGVAGVAVAVVTWTVLHTHRAEIAAAFDEE
jgi:hypothetical protein